MSYSRFKQNFSPQSPEARSGCKMRRSDALPVVAPVAEFKTVEVVIEANYRSSFRFAQDNVD
jgi:hypothetical protein